MEGFPNLRFPAYSFRLRPGEIFDPARKRFVALSPEEWVRQHVIRYLLEEKGVPISLMAVEAGLELNGLKKRVDLVAYSPAGKPVLIVECKAPHIKIGQETFDQAARYNLKLGVDFLFITNGINHYICKSDKSSSTYLFLKELPGYKEICPI
ncbi:MAG TPA: type I restriction enzyme HsdR N-terminal domain-containing protein [Bacteroidia bacterium]|jgi:type I site-specific restriction endonuclease|nr:type I restriction enzyme HsdR N-terminal domain-containing protein [Bacteroidia bacterium]